MKQIFQLLLITVAITSLVNVSQQKGKTYEDLAKLINDNNQLHVKDEDNYAGQSNKDTTGGTGSANNGLNSRTQAAPRANSNSGSKQNQHNNNVVTPPKFSQHELANTKTANQPQYSTQTIQTTGSQYVPPTKEDYDDPNSLSHTKFHSHGPKDLEEKEKAKQIVSDFEKKKKNTQGDDNGRMNLKGVNYHKPNDSKDKFYFFLTCVVLTLTGLLIIGACFGSVYFFYKLTFGNKERYFQFDESKGTNSKLDMELAADRKPSNLSKIIEDPDEEANTSIVKGSRITGTTEVTGNKSSVVHCPVAGNMIFDPEYAGDMSKKSSGSGTFTRQSTKDFQ